MFSSSKWLLQLQMVIPNITYNSLSLCRINFFFNIWKLMIIRTYNFGYQCKICSANLHIIYDQAINKRFSIWAIFNLWLDTNKFIQFYAWYWRNLAKPHETCGNADWECPLIPRKSSWKSAVLVRIEANFQIFLREHTGNH